jgi:hypothetical protein
MKAYFFKILVIFILLTFLCLNYYIKLPTDFFYGIYEWGPYFLAVPGAFSIIHLVSKSKAKSIYIVLVTSVGVVTAILLERSSIDHYCIEKLAATCLGAAATWVISEKLFKL